VSHEQEIIVKLGENMEFNINDTLYFRWGNMTYLTWNECGRNLSGFNSVIRPYS